MNPHVAELVRMRSLVGDVASAGASGRRRFSVERREALRRLRQRPGNPFGGRWSWTLELVRAALVLDPDAAAGVEVGKGEGSQLTTFTFVVPAAALDELDLDELLAGALEPEREPPLGEEESAASRRRRWRHIVGTALNDALARDPVALEIRTPYRGLRWELRDEEAGNYRVGAAARATTLHTIEVVFVEERRGLGARLGTWLTGEDDPLALPNVWSRALVGASPPDVRDVVGRYPLGLVARPEAHELGHHARWGRSHGDEEQGLWLVRDRVRVLDISGVVDDELRDDLAPGFVECPALRLSADRQAVVEDTSLALLKAWLWDLHVHTLAPEPDADPHAPRQVQWAGEEFVVSAASGRPVDAALLRQRLGEGQHVPYVWFHAADQVADRDRAVVHRLLPSQVLALERAIGDLSGTGRLMPYRAYSGELERRRADLTDLRQGALEALELLRDEPLSLLPGARMRISAYVHRHAAAVFGNVMILANDRVVARGVGEAPEGVTLVVHVEVASSMDLERLFAMSELPVVINLRARKAVEDHRAELVRSVLESGRGWEVPYTARALAELSPAALDLRFVARGGALELAWNADPLLDIEVGRTREGEPLRLLDALERLRDAGGLVVGDPDRRWRTLESSDPGLQPWVFDEAGEELVERLLGEVAFWRMPVVPEAYPRPIAASAQLGLLRDESDTRRDLERGSRDAFARLRLLGHLLVARATGGDEQGLADVALFRRYDPRALAPTRLVSLRAIEAEYPSPRLIPSGAVGRSLEGPVLECTPGVARMLHEIRSLEGASRSSSAHALIRDEDASSGVTPRRRRAAEGESLVELQHVDELAVGVLRLSASARPEITLWSRGLRVGALTLEPPHERVSGKMVLTARGQRAAESELRPMLHEGAARLVGRARAHRTLLPARGPRRDALERILSRSEDAEPQHVPDPLDESLRTRPPRPAPGAGRQRLTMTLLQTLPFPGQVRTGLLSWRPARLASDGSGIELGLQNHAIEAAFAVPATAQRNAADPVYEAAVLVLLDIHEQRREGEAPPSNATMNLALWRVLAVRVSTP